MRLGLRVWLAAALAAIACSLWGAAGAGAAIAPPWCGTPMPDAAENLPDGTDPADPPGSFPHIPYYAIGCTLQDIASRSAGRMQVEVIGRSALGRDMYKVTINALDTRAQRNDFARLERVIALAQRNPRRAKQLIAQRELKVPIFIQGSIHGNEYEGTDAVMRTIERVATTPYGEDTQVDAWLDHAVLVFNVIQNPDGRIVGTRANGNGFDLNRDYITQSQPETVASVGVIREWFPTAVYDLHGYVTPTLVEGTTVPHNPGIEYDIWTKWNQPRMDANQAGLASEGFGISRPIDNIPGDDPENDWIPDGETLPQGWDDWGPFYTGQYGQLRGLDAMTVEACYEDDNNLCGINGAAPSLLGRAAALREHELVVESSVDFLVENRREMLYDQYEIYRRGKEDAPRPELTGPLPFPGTPADHDYMTPYPRAHVIPVGAGQRSDAEAKRLVDFLLGNDIEVRQLRRDYRFGGRTFQAGSYVVFLDQSLRALANTMLDVGDDISDRVTELYAPPAAWSNGYLWGADVVTIERDRRFTAATRAVEQADPVAGGVRAGRSDWLALELSSPTAVRTANALIGEGVPARLALEAFETRDGDLPAGSILFAASARDRIRAAGRAAGVWFEPVRGLLPRREVIERIPRVACLCSALENWAIEARLGFASDQYTNASLNAAPADPLADYDVIYNTTQAYPADTPANATVRARYAAFFAAGGGYVGARVNGTSFVAPETGGGAQLAGLEARWHGRRGETGRATEDVDALQEAFGRVVPAFQDNASGIVFWDNEGRESSPITGAYPERDTALVEDPVWFTEVPDDVVVDGRLPASGFLASGHWPNPDPSAGGSPVIVHGPNTAGTARITLFGIDPLFRAHPERSFPAVSEGFYWGDR